MHRRLVFTLAVMMLAGLAASSASGKEGVEATLSAPIPLDASPGDRLTVAWTLASIDEQGERRPFGAMGVFVRLLSASGGKPTTAVASGDGGRTGAYEATVIVPPGGIGGIVIGLHGISSGPTGSSASDVYFPVRNNPLPATDVGPREVGSDATPAGPSEPTSNGSASTWLGALALTLFPLLGGLALVLRRRRRAVRTTSI